MKKISLLRFPARLLGLLSLFAVGHFAQADTYHFETVMTGAQESPSNASPGWGHADVWVDDTAQTMRVKVWFTGLVAGVTASHIHAATPTPGTGTAPVATQTPSFTGFPSNVTSGSYDHWFDLTDANTFRSGFVTANGGTAASASAALLGAMLAEEAYLNIHTTQYPGGEIRGFLKAPDAGSTSLLLLLGLGGLAGFARRRTLKPSV